MKKTLFLPFPSATESRFKTVFLLLLLLATANAQGQATYYWRGAANANFAGTPDNWCTSPTDPVTGSNRRNASTGTDVLVFSGGTPVVTMNSGQTIGRLKFVNNASVTLNSSSNTINTISINGDAPDDDLVVESGSAVALTATGTSNTTAGVVLSLMTNATGRVAGTITLTNTALDAPASRDKLACAAANSLRFTAGGQLNILGTLGSTAFSGVPVFETGSTLEQNASVSSDISAPGLADYRSGSIFRYVDGVFGSADLSTNRIFGNLDFASANGRTIGGAMNLTIFNDLTVTGMGNLVLSARGNSSNPVGTQIGGNVSVMNAAGTLSISPSTAAPNVPKISFTGPAPQTVSSAGTLTFGTNAKLEINNPAGVTLQSDLTISNELILTKGLLTTGNSGGGLLTMAAAATVAGGSSASFVNGPLARMSAAGNSTLQFPTGKVAPNGDPNYRPITLALASQTNAVTYTAQQTEGSGTPFGVSTPVDHVSNRRYYTVSASAPPAGPDFAARITLSFGPDDYVNNATTSSLVVAKRNGGAWGSIGTANTGTGTPSGTPLTGTLMSGPFSSFSDFTLASTTPSTLGYPGLNPLPVTLVRFEAAAKGAAVGLTWATAGEQNSAYFEVQRSATGQAYETLGRVAAQGSSNSLHEYSFTDARPLAGQAYYRLRQADNDGRAAYSPVATVRGNAETNSYPNPAADALVLPAGLGPVRYRLLNGLGQALASGQAVGGDRLDLRTLPTGVFFLELTDATGRRTQRLMRE